MTEQEKKNALSVVWDALQWFREDSIPEGQDKMYDEQWNEITGAMAEITEELGLDSGQPHD